jgi:dTDP-glucose pyrophosphorylase
MFLPAKHGWAIRLGNWKNNTMKTSIQQVIVQKDCPLNHALKQMDEINRKLLIVANDDGTFFSLLSIGDIQRAIIRNLPLNTKVSEIVRQDITVAHPEDDLEKVKQRMQIRRNELMPIIDSQNRVVDIIFWEDLFEEKRSVLPEERQLNLPVVIMAGGRGTRLAPLTNVWPKPLIPVNEKTIIEDIMDQFVEVGCNEFYLSVNYKAEVIQQYFENLNSSCYQISYIQEKKPLGTAGSLYLLRDKIHSTFFVSNCDILIDEDYAAIYEYHRTHHNEITIVAAIKSFPIPYGTIETGEGGQLKSIQEKPELSFKINTGMYILEPNLLQEIPEDEFLHITTLIEKLHQEGRKVGVFPVSEGSWSDIGNWEEYIKKFVKG